jgi:hypothetical protein
MVIVLKITNKALIQLLRTGALTNDSFEFKDVFYHDGERIEQSVDESDLNLKDIDGIEVEG